MLFALKIYSLNELEMLGLKFKNRRSIEKSWSASHCEGRVDHQSKVLSTNKGTVAVCFSFRSVKIILRTRPMMSSINNDLLGRKMNYLVSFATFVVCRIPELDDALV